MVHQAHESIKDVHELFMLQVPSEDIEELSTSITGLLTSTRCHCTAVDQALGQSQWSFIRVSYALIMLM